MLWFEIPDYWNLLSPFRLLIFLAAALTWLCFLQRFKEYKHFLKIYKNTWYLGLRYRKLSSLLEKMRCYMAPRTLGTVKSGKWYRLSVHNQMSVYPSRLMHSIRLCSTLSNAPTQPFQSEVILVCRSWGQILSLSHLIEAKPHGSYRFVTKVTNQISVHCSRICDFPIKRCYMAPLVGLCPLSNMFSVCWGQAQV